MPTQVQLPDGNIGEFPDGMSHEQIEGVLKKQFPPKADAQPNSVTGGIGRRVMDTLKGLGSTFAPPRTPAEFLAGPAVPLLRMGEGAIQSGKQAGGQAIQEAKEAHALPPGNKILKALSYLRAANTGLSALDPLASGTVANVNELQDQGRTREAVGQAIPDVAMLAAGTRVGKALTPDVPGFLKGKLEKITKTGPGATGTFIAKTADKNAIAVEDAAKVDAKNEKAYQEKLAKVEEDRGEAEKSRKLDLRKHFDNTQDVEAAQGEHRGKFGKDHPLTPAEAASRKSAAARGVEHIDEPLREDLTKTRETVKEEADRRYNTQRTELNKKQIPFVPAVAAENPDAVTSENFTSKVTDAWDSAITGSETRPPIIKSIEGRINSTEPLTWKDLQGYRSELSKKISSGTLPGDEYYGYKKVLGVVDDGMQKIADANGMGKQVAADRAFYRQYMETFRDPKSPVYRAINATERGGTLKALRTTDRSGIEAVAKYNPELAKRLNSTREALETSKKPTPAATLRSLPKLSPKPEPIPDPERPPPVKPDVKVVTPSTISQFKSDQVLGKGENLEATSNRMATIFTGLDALRNIAKRNPAGMAVDFGARGVFGFIQNTVGKMLENPSIVNRLSNLTQADVEHAMRLPPEQRAGFVELVKQAQAKGVKVPSAAIAAMGVAATPKKRVAAALSQ